MRKTFKYRIFPKKSQRTKLYQTLDECRWLYNHLLEQRKTAIEQAQKSRSLYGQQSGFRHLKRERKTLLGVHSQVLQNVAVRIEVQGRMRRSSMCCC